MICAAILLAEEVVAPGLGGTEPHRIVMAGNDVHLDAESGDRKVVNDVFAGQDELDVAANGNVQLVNLAQASGLLNLPHPLLPDYVDIERIHGSATIVHVHNSAPAKHGQGQKQRNYDPGSLQSHVAVNRNAHLSGMFATVLKKEIDDRGRDGDSKECADGGDIGHQPIDVHREVRGL